jgi:uncharacterized protein with ParB-like and HNH nuclease domain
MKADNLAIAKIFSSGGDVHYVLPHFQREYTWDKKDWETLLTDALAVYEEMLPADGGEGYSSVEHFLGSIVVIHDGMRAGMVSTFKLVDGQQRLTTISLLLKALSKQIEVNHPALSKKIERLLVNADETGEIYFKILPTVKYGDRESYCALLTSAAAPVTTSKIEAAYRFFSEQLSSKLAAGLDAEKLLHVIINAFQVVFVNLDQKESPYRIFESLNAKGKPLTQADLVRNYIAMKLPSVRQERIFTALWSPVEELLQETRNVGRLPELTAFLRHYLAMISGVLCDETHVYARFRDRAEKEFEEVGAFETELAAIAKFAKYYDQLLRPEGIADDRIRSALIRLNKLEILTSYPFLLRVLEAREVGRLTDFQVLDTLAVLENYMVRRYLAAEPQSYLNRMFPTLWANVQVDDFSNSLRSNLGQKNYPTNAKVRRSLETRKLYDKSEHNRRRTTLVLESINRRLSEGSGGFTVLDSQPTIEHVMPQTLSDGWKTDLGLHWEQIFRDYLHTLGNLTLVTSGWNSSLSNARFATKREKLESHALLINKSYFKHVLSKWTRDEMRERAEFLTDLILEIWPSFIPDEADTEEHLPRLGERPEASEFDEAALERVAKKIASGLNRLSQARFQSGDGTKRVVGLCSKGYPRPGGMVRYWYGVKSSQKEFLEGVTASWIAFECERPDTIVLLPFSVFQPILQHLRETPGKHWHVDIHAINDTLRLIQPTGYESLDVRSYLL